MSRSSSGVMGAPPLAAHAAEDKTFLPSLAGAVRLPSPLRLCNGKLLEALLGRRGAIVTGRDRIRPAVSESH